MSNRKHTHELPCLVAIKIETMWDNGRKDEAEQLVIRHLKKGFHSADFSKVVGKIVEWKNAPRTKGQPPKLVPTWWYEIGCAFDDLNGNDHPTRTIKDLVKEKYGSLGTVRKAVKYYQAAQAAHDEATRNFLEEQAGIKK
jgi:hypothetical protein